MDVKVIDRKEERRLLQMWFDTVQFNTESTGIPPLMPDDEDDDDEMKLAPFVLETKAIRRVRTPAGVRRYKQPIGSIIVRDGLLHNMELAEPQYDGWERVRDKNTGAHYQIGQDDNGKWIVTTDDDWTPVVSADNEQDAYLILDDYLTPEGQPKPSAQRGQRSQELSQNVREEIADQLAENGNTISDHYDEIEARDILWNHQADSDPLETRTNIRRWLNDNPNADPEVREIMEAQDGYLTRRANLPRNTSLHEDQTVVAENAARRQAEADTPRRVKLGEVQEGDWINLPDRDPNAWYQVERVGVHSAARRSFTVRDQNGKRTSVNQVTNREHIQTAANPPSPSNPNSPEAAAAERAVNTGQQLSDEEFERRVLALQGDNKRAVRDAINAARAKRRAGYDGETDLAEAEVSAGLRPREDLARSRAGEYLGPPEPRDPDDPNNMSYTNLEQIESDYDDWDLFRGADGNNYYLGRQGNDWVVTDPDSVILHQGRDRESVLRQANERASRRQTPDRPRRRQGVRSMEVSPEFRERLDQTSRAYNELDEENEIWLAQQRVKYGRNRNRWPSDVLAQAQGREMALTQLRIARNVLAEGREPSTAQGPLSGNPNSPETNASQRRANAPLSMDITDDNGGRMYYQGQSIPVSQENGRWIASELPDGSGEISARNPQELVSRVAQRLGVSGQMTIEDERENTGRRGRPNLSGTVDVPAGAPSMVLGGRSYTADQMLAYAQRDPAKFLREWAELTVSTGGRQGRIARPRFDSIAQRIDREGWSNERAARELREWARLELPINRTPYLTAASILDGSARPNTRAHRQEDLEVKDRINNYIKAIRRVRTPQGERRYGQPIGSIIVRDGASPLDNLRVGANNREVRDTSGNRYQTREGNNGWEAFDDGGNVVASADSEEELLEELDRHVGSSSNNSNQNQPDPNAPAAPEAQRSDSDDDGDRHAYKGPDGAIYYATETDDGKWEVRDSNNVVIAEGADSEDDAVSKLNERLATIAGGNDGSGDPAPEAPEVGPVMPDSEQARAEIARGLRNASEEQLRNAVRQGGGNPDGLSGEDLFSAALQVMFFLLLGVPLPRSFFTSKAEPWAVMEAKAMNDYQHTGAMIALIPSAADINRLADELGEDADELHVTLQFLGKAADISENAKLRLTQAAGMLANNINVMELRAFSINVFNPHGEEPCVVMGVGGQQIRAVRDAVDSMCKEIQDEEPGFTIPEQHEPYVPHITLRYFRDGEPIDMDWVEDQFDKLGTVTLDKVRVAFGGKYIDMPLVGKDMMGDVAVDSEYKAPVITPGGRRGNDRRIGSRRNRENWVEQSRSGHLPRYIRIVRNGLMREGHSQARATALAVAAVKRWARGGDKVSPKVQAAAAKAVAEWEAMKAGARGGRKDMSTVDRMVVFLKASNDGLSHIGDRIAEGGAAAAAAARRAGSAPSSGGGKKRRVASRAGESRYGKPIGSEIGKTDVERKKKADNLPDAIKKRLPMEYGQQGPHIKRVQDMLDKAGFPLETDGIFGPKTRAAIKEAQKQLGLKVTGVVDPITYVAIVDARKATGKASTRKRPTRKRRASN